MARRGLIDGFRKHLASSGAARRGTIVFGLLLIPVGVVGFAANGSDARSERPAMQAVIQSTSASRAADDETAHHSLGPQGPEAGSERRQVWLLPLPGESLLMHAVVLRPQGSGPFPLVVINHGSSQNAARRESPMPQYNIMSLWFLDRGFVVVLPVRPGHGETGGPYFEYQGRCEDADYRKAGVATADSIQAAIDYMTAQPFVKKSGVIVVGQSAGGWGTLALASRNLSSVKGVINFAGGRGGRSHDLPDNNCSPDSLVMAAAEFGRTTRAPALWLYAENDSYFAPRLSKRMYQAFAGAGGRGEYHLLPRVGAEGHNLIETDAWASIVDRFLAQL